MKLIMYFLIPAIIIVQGCLTIQSGTTDTSTISIENIFESFITLFPDTVAYKSETKSYKWNYEQGLILEAFYRMWRLSGKEKYYDYLKKNIDYYVEPDGNIKTYKLDDYNLDNIAPGRGLLRLYSETGEKKYRNAADRLMKQLQNQPRTTEGGFWHKRDILMRCGWMDCIWLNLSTQNILRCLMNRNILMTLLIITRNAIRN